MPCPRANFWNERSKEPGSRQETTSRGTLRQANKRFSEPKEVLFMFSQYDIPGIQKQTPQEESQSWAGELENYLTPYSQRLEPFLYRRWCGKFTPVAPRN